MNLAHTQFQPLKHMLRTVQAEGLGTFFQRSDKWEECLHAAMATKAGHEAGTKRQTLENLSWC